MTVKKAHNNKNRAQRSFDQDEFSSQVYDDKPGLAARMAAAKILAAVLDKKTSLDGMLDTEHGNPVYRALSIADRALVRAIINSSLRHLPRIDAAISSLLDGPLPQGARSLNHILVIAVAQMLYLDVPDHSAVDLAVEQAQRDPRNKRFVKLVNAVLRRLGREKQRVIELIEQIAVLPEWFFSRIQSHYGDVVADRISAAQLIPSSIDITVKSEPQDWATKLGGTVMPNGTVRLGTFSGSVTQLEGFAEGEWWVQDFSASLPVRLMGNIEGKRVADLCAAPGGKTAQLALAGAKVTALDQSSTRLRRLRENLKRLNYSVEFIESNMLKYTTDELYDAVLLDAPCSSTGTIRKHPDVIWTKDAADIAKLAGLQEQMLEHAIGLVKSDGIIVFSNCSLDPSEGEDMVERILAQHQNVERVAISKDDWPELATAINDKGELRTTPDMFGGVDGFFACVFRKI